MRKNMNSEAYILGLELTVKNMACKIKELEEKLQKDRIAAEANEKELMRRIASLEADIRRTQIEKDGRGNGVFSGDA